MATKKQLGRSWYYLTKPERKHRSMRWVTIIIGAIRIRRADLADDEKRQAICSRAAQMVEEYRATWTGLTRGRHLSRMTWRGAIELDLRRAITPGGHCQSTLTAMGVDTSPLAEDERVLVVHAHLVLAADHVADNDQDGERWASAAGDAMRRAWPGPWRVLAKSLWPKQSVREAVTALYGYATKRLLRYSEGGWGDVPTQFMGPYEWPWARLVSEVYRGLETELRSRR